MASTNSTKLNIQVAAKVQEVEVPNDFDKIICPSRMVIAGPTLVGKSRLALKLVKYRTEVYNSPFERVLYSLPPETVHLHVDFIKELRNVCPHIQIIEGMPDQNDLHLTAGKAHKLLIIDDQMSETFNSQVILNLITRDSHHSNISVVIIVQSLFADAKHRITMVRNCSEKLIFFNKVDKLPLITLSRQIFPGHSNFLTECFDVLFEVEKSDDLKYLLIDASPLSLLPHKCIVRTNIFPASDGKIRPIFFFPE